MSDKRISRRVRCSVAEYAFLDKSSEKRSAFVKDLSQTGICLVTHEPIEPGTLLSLYIYLPYYNIPLSMTAVVVWSSLSLYFISSQRHHFDLGIEFKAISSHDKRLLIDYVGYFDKHSLKDEL